MKPIFFKITLLLFFASFFVFCQKEKSKETSITTCIITVNGKDYTVTFDATTKKATISLPDGTNIPSEATLKDLAIASGASSSVVKGATITITENKATIVITAEDGTKATFTIEFTTKYIVTFKGNGGTEIPAQNINPGGKATKPENPTRDGNIFDGWYKDETFTTAFDFDNDVITANTTLYAKWNVTISFNTNEGSAVPAQTITSGGKVAKPTTTRNGYTLINWYKDEALTIVFNFDNDVINAHTTLYAKWGSTVTLDANDGVLGAKSSLIVDAGAKIILPSIVADLPTRIGHTFNGWNTQREGKGTIVTNDYIPQGHITIYAQWTINKYTVSFNSDGGITIPDILNVIHGDKITAPNPLLGKGGNFSFAGWYKDNAFANAFDDTKDVITGPTTLYAKWVPTVAIWISFTGYSLLPDANFRNELKTKYASAFKGDSINTNADVLKAVTTLDVNTKSIDSLDGIELFTKLDTLDCSFNQLTSLILEKNVALTYLNCGINQLSSLILEKNVALTYLACGLNQLSSLNVENNVALTYLDCSLNQLSSLNVTNNVDLTTLNCNNNRLSPLNVTNNVALTTLNCSLNKLSTLILEKNVALTFLICNNNQLSSLILEKNVALTFLYCYNNNLTNLDIRGMRSVRELKIRTDGAPTASTTNNVGLTSLKVHDAIKDDQEIKNVKTFRQGNVSIKTYRVETATPTTYIPTCCNYNPNLADVASRCTQGAPNTGDCAQ